MTSEVWSSETVTVVPPSLPTTGATLSGMGESQASAGVDGMATFSVPLVQPAGRGTAPDCALVYNAANGNGELGIGWSLPVASVARSTIHGVPRYQDEDVFLAPDGSELTPYLDAQGQPEVRRGVEAFRHAPLDQSYTVRRYGAQIESRYELIERWCGEQDGQEFWLISHRDGSVSCFGRTAQACLSDPADPTRIGEWYQEELLAPNGEHLCFHYRGEDGAGIEGDENRERQNWRYLERIDYAGLTPHGTLYCLTGELPAAEQFFFHVVFDYGARSPEKTQIPTWDIPAGQQWEKRLDVFSRYTLGFETRCYRLCRQILMFSRDVDNSAQEPTLINRYLLSYTQSEVMSCLKEIRRLAYEEIEGQWHTLEKAPLVFDYTTADLNVSQSDYVSLPGWAESDRGGGTLVDLWGEGYAGWLWRQGDLWGYQAPVRDEHAPDGVGYGPWQPLSLVPAIGESGGQGHNLLLDINGDGYLDWVVLRPELNGFFALDSEQNWHNFTPFSAFPSEFFHPQSQFADLVGNGLLGVALIGPHTVRFYANQRTGFSPVTIHCHDETLPVPSVDEHEWVALANPLGNGSTHLVRVRYNQVVCWAGLGYGRFGKAITLSLPDDLDSAEGFRPQHLYLVDVDGSGTDDLLYATPQGLNYYRNLSGNGFAQPQRIPWPVGFSWDDVNSLQFAPMSGQGLSLVVSERHMGARHWRLTLTTQQPWLLKSIDNRRGLRSELRYRSSADFWLDEKQNDPQRRSQLPVRLTLLETMEQYDEITRCGLSVSYRYRRGRYDTEKRRYCGYYQIDKIEAANNTGEEGQPLHKPRLLRSWFHTGHPEDARRREGYFSSPGLTDSWLTEWRQQSDVPLPDALPDLVIRRLHYALKGSLLRQELFDALDERVPFSVEENRYQVRLLQQQGENPRVARLVLETLSINYQQETHDLACQHNVVMAYDGYGETLHDVAISYPRARAQGGIPDNGLSELQWENTFDEAQYLCWFNETQQRWHHLTAPEYWYLGIADRQWQYSLSLQDTDLTPGVLFNREQLQAADSPVAPAKPRTLLGFQQMRYLQSDGQISYPPRIVCQEQAALDDATKRPYLEYFDDAELMQQLTDAGYRLSEPEELGQAVWLVPGTSITYLDESGFYLPVSSENLRGGIRKIRYDLYYRQAAAFIDEFDQETQQLENDYRFWQTICIRDINHNIGEVRINAFGEAVAQSQYGTEGGQEVGFVSLDDFQPTGDLTLEEALARAPELLGSRAAVNLYNENEYQNTPSLPAWSLTIRAIDYPDKGESHQIDLVYYDGHGSPWQSFSLDNEGDAYLRDEQGYLRLENGQLVQERVDTRWVINHAGESTLLGGQVRQYIPWFIDSHLPILDSRLAQILPCELNFYDAQGKLTLTQTAKGYLRYQRYFPWFSLFYDENDTLQVWISDQSTVRIQNQTRNQLTTSGYRGELADIERQSVAGTEVETQRYHLNAGERTYLPEFRQSLTPGPNIAQPYTLPGNPDYEITYGARELGIAFGVVSLLFSIVTVGAGFFITSVVAASLTVLGGVLGVVSAGLGISAYLVTDPKQARVLAEVSFWLGIGSLVSAGFGSAYQLFYRSSGRVLQVTAQGGQRCVIHPGPSGTFVRIPDVRPVVLGSGRRLPSGTLIQLHGSKNQTVNIAGIHTEAQYNQLARYLVDTFGEATNSTQPIYLMSCHAADGGNASFAMRLSSPWRSGNGGSGLGRPVYAFDASFTIVNRTSYWKSLLGRANYQEGESILFSGGIWGKIKQFSNGRSQFI
ncbi:SpvB/TcaC N-terminal domain-containing protein [Enterobacter mori]|uniref:SpvB/TcaC N-terminal domain-containing protein n=1 Tax=Enterobacter mori TaxID=539813 RepID=UPI001B8C5663|nr:SpvB/TcaC N-terminal domain-containing protein [Enterobacter mori]MBS3049637.1 hypothetical protein [Enterobacter mori]